LLSQTHKVKLGDAVHYKTVFARYDNPRIHDLGPAWLFTNSDKGTFGCKRKFAWNNVECISLPQKNEALNYGSAWHLWMEEVLAFIKEHDRVPSKKEHWGIFQEKIGQVLEEALVDFKQEANFEKIKQGFYDRIYRSIEGWRLNWERQVHPKYKVLEIEMVVVAPIQGPDGGIFAPEMPILTNHRTNPTTLRPPLVGEVKKNRLDGEWHDAVREFPWYKVGKIDVLLEHRATGNLIILDHKTSSYPSSYESKFNFDMQMPSYAALLKWEIEHGDFYSQYRGKIIDGMVWDICHSKIPAIPEPNKDGTLSVKKTCASWVYKMALKKHQLEMTPEYEKFIQKAEKEHDKKYFVIVESFLTQNAIDRCRGEDLAQAYEMHRTLCSLYNMSPTDGTMFDVLAPRYPLCDKWGKCGISNICFANYTPCAITNVRQPKLYWEAT